MYDSPGYPQPDAATIEAFVQSQPYAVVLGTGAEGHPSASLLPFVKVGDRITVHMVQADPTFQALARDPRGSVLIEEFLAFTPHTLVSPDYAGQATLHFRAVIYEVEATLTTAPERVAEALEEALARYEADAPHLPVADLSVYGHDLVRLARADFRVLRQQAKFKTAQSKDAATRQRLVAYLRERGEWRDDRAADVIEAVDRPRATARAEGRRDLPPGGGAR
jgi:predicted FMN-binding regulatory protein PaiB